MVKILDAVTNQQITETYPIESRAILLIASEYSLDLWRN
jgi:hypothetical protein